MVIIKTFTDQKLFSCNVYVLSSVKGIIVVDPGYYDEDFREYVQKLGRVDAILLSHGHIDHVRGLDDLKADFPDAPIYIGSKEESFLTNPAMICGFMLHMEDFKVNSKAIPLEEGHYNLGGYEVDVLLTPGHTFGGLTYIFREENIMFTGDAVMHHDKTPIDRPTGNEHDRDATMQQFLKLNVPKDMMVYSGHQEFATMKQMLEESPDLKDLKR